jgi:hypothetical protein
MRNHLGTSFRVWNRRSTWFWLVRDQHGKSGAIGTAVSEAEAIREACASIEEMAAQAASLPARPIPTSGNALLPTFNQGDPCNGPLIWMDWWMSVAYRLTDKMLTQWADLVLRSS